MDRAEQVAALSGAAADQWGLVTSAQAKELGVGGVQLLRLTEAGLLTNVGRGVYQLAAVGVPPHLEVKVAWLRLQPKWFVWDRAVGNPDSGVVSHASACQLLSLGDIPAPDVEISVPRRRTTTEPFVRLRTAQIAATEITTVDGLPVTTAARTITDLLHTGADGGHIGGVIADAERRDLVTIDDLAERVQPFARKYGLKAAATGHDLINHLVAQAGESLRRQEVDRASQEGFDQAVHLLAERPDLVKLMWAARAAGRQPAPSPAASVLDPALLEAIRKLSQPDPAVSEAVRKMLQPSPALMESIRKTLQPNPMITEAMQKMMRPMVESMGKAAQPNPEVMQKIMQPLVESLRKSMQPDPAIGEAVRKMLQPDPGITRALRGSVALPPGTLNTLGQATAPASTSERASAPRRSPDAENAADFSDGHPELDDTNSQEAGEADSQPG
ncbi:type IV toxin-antitoxin system AbiEi family antitoxin domain-containing protein [Streptomyces sp. NPDC015139]|uniref:type IV toxin-antitoxin system AbiEi family antitoxin domain-containing protein n=1 Tax=Streptomyces sp. NPDC015139 TaxID=3364942 RepID=UPI0036F56720